MSQDVFFHHSLVYKIKYSLGTRELQRNPSDSLVFESSTVPVKNYFLQFSEFRFTR